MWDQGYENAGGFDLNASQTGGATPGGDKKRSRAQNLVPVRISDILSSGEEGLKVEGREVGIVTVVAKIKTVDQQATKTTYLMNDGSGDLEVVHWTETDGKDGRVEPFLDNAVTENMYARVIGSVRSQKDKRHVMAFRVSPLECEEEVDTHFLEVAYAKLKLRQLLEKENMAIGGNSVLSNSMMGSAGAMSMTSSSLGNPKYDAIIKVLSGCQREEGLSRDEMMAQVKSKMSRKDLDDALEHLSHEGHIYSTMDEDHFRTTDG